MNIQEFSTELENLLHTRELHNKIPFQEIGRELDMPIGFSIGENILPFIQKLKTKMQEREEEILTLRNILKGG
ncbi:hypothetical protein LCGC14_0549830 [marine sediment metagenome]|uniref:Uncharacterized protein n=1 Tax=marine sediment metagenome TaxID=412755 RepID=A0A0F9UBP9_9ZZZZ